MKYISSCSFGKDSIATILLAREHSEPLDEIVYCEVMFDKDISGELPEHRDFIYSKAIPTFESWGYKVTILKSEKSYMDCFHHKTVRGKSVGMKKGYEPKRLDRIADTENKVSLLEKYGYTEEMAKQKCLGYGLLSPIYEFTSRGGCWFCPNARDCGLKHLRNNHNDLWNKLLELENTPNLIGNKWNTLTKTSIHDKEEQFMWEDRQMNIFDYIMSQ